MTFAVCKASARMRRITSPSLLTTYDAKVPSGIPSSHAVEMVPVLAMATRVLAHSAEVGRSESMSAVSPAAVAGADVAVSVATRPRGDARVRRAARRGPRDGSAEVVGSGSVAGAGHRRGGDARRGNGGAGRGHRAACDRKKRVGCSAARCPRASGARCRVRARTGAVVSG